MLDTAISLLADQVNAYLTRRTESGVVKVRVGSIVDDNGKWMLAAGELRLCVVAIEEERVVRSQFPDRLLGHGSENSVPQELKLSVNVLFAVRPFEADYASSLRQLGQIASFLHAHPVFEPVDTSELDPRIERMVVEPLSLTTDQLPQLWACLGAKYLPSVAYRLRLIAHHFEVSS